MQCAACFVNRNNCDVIRAVIVRLATYEPLVAAGSMNIDCEHPSFAAFAHLPVLAEPLRQRRASVTLVPRRATNSRAMACGPRGSLMVNPTGL